jgi:integrase
MAQVAVSYPEKFEIVKKFRGDWNDPEDRSVVSAYADEMAWLLSAFSDNVWLIVNDLSPELEPCKLNFEIQLGSHGMLTDTRHKGALASFKNLMLLQRLNVDRGLTLVSDYQNMSHNLRTYVKVYIWGLDRGKTSLREFNEYDMIELLEDLPKRYSLLYTILSPLEHLVEFYINEDIKPPTYYKCGKTLLDIKEIGKILNISHHTIRQQHSTSVLDRLRLHFGIDLKDRKEFNFDENNGVNARQSTLDKRCRAVNNLFVLSQVDPELDAFQIPPFAETSISNYVKTHALKGGRTKTVEVELMFSLMSDACEFLFTNKEFVPQMNKIIFESDLMGVEDLVTYNRTTPKFSYNDEYIAKLRNKYRVDKINEAAESLDLNIKFKSWDDAANHTKLMWGACSIIILGFTARRDIEIKRLTTDCLTEVPGSLSFGENNDLGKYLLRSYVAKTERNYDVFPANDLLVTAINTVKNMSVDARDYAETDVLFFSQDTNTSHISEVKSISRYINAFAEHFGANKDQHGNKHDFSCHQFRRFFAILYYWRYGANDVYTLSKYLGHFSIEMTKVYITELVGQGMMNEEEQAFLAEHLRKIQRSDKNVGGIFGKTLTKLGTRMKNKIKAKLKITKVTNIESLLTKAMMDIVQGHELRVTFTDWGLCFGTSPSRSHLSKCNSDNSDQIDLKAASWEVCRKCPNHCFGQEQLPSLNASRKNAERFLDSELIILKANAERQIKEIDLRITELTQ